MRLSLVPRHHLARSAGSWAGAALVLGPLLVAGCFNPFDPRVASTTGISKPPVASRMTKSAGSSCLRSAPIPTSSLATEKVSPPGQMNTSNCALATSIPTNRFTSSMLRPPQRGLPRLAIRDFLLIQPFGLSAIGGAATLAARRDLSPKGAPVCRTTNSDPSTKSSTYKGVEEGV